MYIQKKTGSTSNYHCKNTADICPIKNIIDEDVESVLAMPLLNYA